MKEKDKFAYYILMLKRDSRVFVPAFDSMRFNFWVLILEGRKFYDSMKKEDYVSDGKKFKMYTL